MDKTSLQQTKQVEIQKMTQKQYFIMFFLTVIVTFTFYFVLKALNNANLALSTVSVATSCIAAYLVFMRSPYYAVGYAMNDIILIILWVLATIENVAYTPMIACFIVFLINDLYAFVNWKKMEKKQIM